MTSNTLDNPAEFIQPMVVNTPFGKSGYVHEDDLAVYLEKTNLEYFIFCNLPHGWKVFLM